MPSSRARCGTRRFGIPIKSIYWQQNANKSQSQDISNRNVPTLEKMK
jgi:hypothetical protein